MRFLTLFSSYDELLLIICLNLLFFPSSHDRNRLIFVYTLIGQLHRFYICMDLLFSFIRQFLSSVAINIVGQWRNLLDLQAYYGPRMALPPYYNTAMPPGYAPHPYVWGPPQVLPRQLNTLCYIDVAVIYNHLLVVAAYNPTIWYTLCSSLLTWRCVCTSCSSHCKSMHQQIISISLTLIYLVTLICRALIDSNSCEWGNSIKVIR